MSGISQEELQKTFRVTELQRREWRRKRLINEMALAEEHLSPEDLEADRHAKAYLQEMQLQHEKEIKPSYWKRLFRALLAR